MRTAAVKPSLRGVSHQWALLVAVVAGTALVVATPAGSSRLAVAVYVASLCGMLGASASYHRIDWSPRCEGAARRLDHSMIFVLVAGTYTPFAVLVMDGPMADAVLVSVWSAALLGVVFTTAFTNPPTWLRTGLCAALGWASLIAAPQLIDHAGLGAAGLLLLGGLLYTAGGVVYVRQRPDPVPHVFGFHEVFHVLVLAASAVHFAAVAIYALPGA
ncbi:MAG: hemolysin III family protein [Solirubrobacteraceae bacterium]|nr:hemolysin III family protein [Solirubrobacteraceae bacterium]